MSVYLKHLPLDAFREAVRVQLRGRMVIRNIANKSYVLVYEPDEGRAMIVLGDARHAMTSMRFKSRRDVVLAVLDLITDPEIHFE